MSSPLQLSIDHPNRLFAPGDTITGAVSGWDPNNNDGSSVHIIFEGRSKSYIQLKGQLIFNYKDRSPLLYQVTNLTSSDYDVGSQNARFAITIPETVQDDLSHVAALTKDSSYWTHSWTPLADFEQEGGYALPPSMVMAKRHLNKFSMTVFGWGYIRYTITAIRTKVEEKHKKKKVIATGSSQKVIWMTTRRTPEDEVDRMERETPTIVEQSLGVSTKRLDPSVGDRKRSFRETMGGMFSETPMFRFQPVVTIPKVAVVGRSTRISFRLQVLPLLRKGVAQEGYKFPLPPITLQKATLCLKDAISVRCKGSAVTSNYHYDFADKGPTERNYTIGHTFYPTSDGKAYQDTPCEVNFEVPSSCIPTHRTCNFNKKWDLQGEVLFSCLDKEMRAAFESEVQLVSRPRKRVVRLDEVDGAAGLMASAEDEDEDEEEDAADVIEMATAFLETVNAGLEIFNAFANA